MCDDCIVSLAKTENIHLPNKYECDVCEETFQTKTLFKKHKNCDFRFESSLKYICEDCGYFWKHENYFNQHMYLKHEVIKCVRCSLKFTGKESLDHYFRTKHRAF